MKNPIAPSTSIIRDFRDLTAADEVRVGGKACTLGILLQAGFPVPEGCVLDRPPSRDDERMQILAWWSDRDEYPLAVRSSAVGEDSIEHSFAGQQKTYLGISVVSELFPAIAGCYESIRGERTQAYRGHFGIRPDQGTEMNVILQRMITPRFAGVYFSQDPRDGCSGWVVEAVEGLGERLVSGEVTPCRFSKSANTAGPLLTGWKPCDLKAIVETGQAVKERLGYEVDMEWAIDSAGKLWVLQARPITSLKRVAAVSLPVERELRRLCLSHPSNTIWDGNSFAEWTGIPTPLSLSVWQLVFSARGALGGAMRKAGYLGRDAEGSRSLLESVFGRPYVNLLRLERLYFGPSAYVTVPEPHPHLEFRWDRVNLETMISAPLAAFRMARAAWRLQADRSLLLKECRDHLKDFGARDDLKRGPEAWNRQSLVELADELYLVTLDFTEISLVFPMLLIILAESTEQMVRDTLTRSQGRAASDSLLQDRMRTLRTLTVEMDQLYEKACDDATQRSAFLLDFGQRGPGELELENPRWRELGERAFHRSQEGAGVRVKARRPSPTAGKPVENEVIAGALARDELHSLAEMLELREQWKSETMRQYAQIRWILLEISKRLALPQNQIFQLRLREVLKLARSPSATHLKTAAQLIERRVRRRTDFAGMSLPAILNLRKLRGAVVPASEGSAEMRAPMHGAALSPGLAFGVVRVIRDPSSVDFATLPENMILVAEATDPGWTPLFLRAKAVVVERGGILSHCAIVARELGLPAVSGIPGCASRLKDGNPVWVDGTNGYVNPA